MATLGTVTLKLHLTTEIGGPIELGVAEVPVTARVENKRERASLHVDWGVLRHEIANALIDAANQIDKG